MVKISTIFCLFVAIFFCSTSGSENESFPKENVTTCDITPYGDQLYLETGIPPEFPEKQIAISSFFMITVGLVAVVSNALIIHVVVFNSHMHTTTNFLILNMAVGDLLSAVIGTSWTVKYMQSGSEWTGDKIFGEYIWCKLGCPLYYICMLSSIYSLLVITFDRFLAVSRPFQYKQYSSWTIFAIPAIWIISAAVPMHLILEKMKFCLIEGRFYCITKKSPFDALLLLSVGFIIPHVFIAVLYIFVAFKLWKRRLPGKGISLDKEERPNHIAKKVTRMIIAILFAFQISWGPVFYGYVFPYLYLTDESQSYANTFYYKCLMISNGILNAIIYAVFNDNFRCAFKHVLLFKLLREKVSRVKPQNKVESDVTTDKEDRSFKNTSDTSLHRSKSQP